MKIYTRTGDQGKTSVIGGRVSKDDARVEAYGTVDELNSAIGMSVSLMNEERHADMRRLLARIQHELFDSGADLATLQEAKAEGAGAGKSYQVTAGMTEYLEARIDEYTMETPPLNRFILPGGCIVSSQLHICRTICRRAERRVVALAAHARINPEVRTYLNRLSDLLFTMARAANVRDAVADVEYIRNTEVSDQS